MRVCLDGLKLKVYSSIDARLDVTDVAQFKFMFIVVFRFFELAIYSAFGTLFNDYFELTFDLFEVRALVNIFNGLTLSPASDFFDFMFFMNFERHRFGLTKRDGYACFGSLNNTFNPLIFLVKCHAFGFVKKLFSTGCRYPRLSIRPMLPV